MNRRTPIKRTTAISDHPITRAIDTRQAIVLDFGYLAVIFRPLAVFDSISQVYGALPSHQGKITLT